MRPHHVYQSHPKRGTAITSSRVQRSSGENPESDRVVYQGAVSNQHGNTSVRSRISNWFRSISQHRTSSTENQQEQLSYDHKSIQVNQPVSHQPTVSTEESNQASGSLLNHPIVRYDSLTDPNYKPLTEANNHRGVLSGKLVSGLGRDTLHRK